MEAAIPKRKKHIISQQSVISQDSIFINYAVKTSNQKWETA
jgi:hypothetical protein